MAVVVIIRIYSNCCGYYLKDSKSVGIFIRIHGCGYYHKDSMAVGIIVRIQWL
jgi:hypothetical protein